MIATNIRKKAREALAGKWSKGAIITFILMLIIVSINLLTVKLVKDNIIVANILSGILTFVSVPLGLGTTYAFIKLKRNEEVKVLDFIKLAFTNFVKSWSLMVATIIKMILPIICIIVGIVLFVIMACSSYKISFGLLVVGVIVYLAAMVYAVVIGLRYTLSYYISYDNANINAFEAVNESARLMKGHKGDYFVLILSFLGWAIISVLTFGIGLLWLIPYMQTATVCFYDEILEKNK